MIPYLARLLDITMNNGTLPVDWKRAIVIPIHKGGDRMGHVIASYLRQVWDKNDWLYEGQHGFRPGYLCKSQVITVLQDTADCLDNGDKTDTIIVDFLKVLIEFLMVGC